LRTVTSEVVEIKIPAPFWYSMTDVWSLRREHILFVISWADLLEEGKYPPEHKETGYVGGGKSTRNQQCPFAKPIEILTEVCIRLNMCGTTEYSPSVKLWESILDQSPLQPESYVKLTPEEIKVLDYCSSGFDRRQEKFKEWNNGNPGDYSS
jgi:hypothetical protein